MAPNPDTTPVDERGHGETLPAPDTPEPAETLETVEFALDGVAYEIDLPASRAAALREALAVYVAHARRARSRTARQGARRPDAAAPTSSATAQNRAIREWARRQGKPLGGRGRIPSSFVEAYHRDQRQIVHTKFSPLATAIAQYRWTHGS